ncbi:MAG TPA: RNA polymerase sigma-70 factor [Puia sp.]|uniref:RNA polymerase sigma factor n=1 Tax=Puia sp. TaxID=2045100 RepID=UPI002B8C3F9E|nr:RNA polymerase sigma-70 factor [Puia sp.]HVU94343.1 RNA polymerase sigma-70 factor [Puia sp.]
MSALPPYEEKQLLRALTTGDRPAYTALYSRYLDSLFQYIFLFTGEKETAEEITQDVFLKIWEKRATLGELDSFKAYLFRAAKNQLINYINREKIRIRVTGRLGQRADTAPNNQDTAHQVDFRQAQALLREAIRALPPRRKQVFLLSTEENLSLDEIAARMGISKNVVKKQLYDAYGNVRDYLAEHGELSFYLILLMTLLQA